MAAIASRVTARTVLRWLCFVTALANAGGNVLILLFYEPIFAWLGVPLPRDVASFAFVSGFSFTVGVLAWMVFRDPEANRNLLVVGIVGKSSYAALTFAFFHAGELHWFYRLFGVWDAAFAVVFLLFFIHLSAPDLAELNRGTIHAGGPGVRTRRALLLSYSLTGNGARALKRVEAGLAARGYAVDARAVESAEPLFHFPFSLGEFVRIMLRAIFRVPAKIQPLGIGGDHPYDLVVVACQTWFVGLSAPMEAVFQDPRNRGIFDGRDVAVVTVCRGLARRTQAQTVRWVEACGGRVVGARALQNPGREPMRTFALFFFLGAGAPGRPAWLSRVLTPQLLSTGALEELERFGGQLAERPLASPPRAAVDRRQVA